MKTNRLCVEINNPILNTVINMKDKVYVGLFWLGFAFILFVGLNFPYLLIAVLVIPYFIFECIKEKAIGSCRHDFARSIFGITFLVLGN